MPGIIGFIVLTVGGLVLWRVLSREFARVNDDLDTVRSGRAGEKTIDLKRDPRTGTYKPEEPADPTDRA